MLKIFIALATQWRRTSTMMAIVYDGLDYTSVKSTLELMGKRRREWPEIFANLQLMEGAALKVFREKESDG